MNASHQLHSSDENLHLSICEKILRILPRSLREKQNVTESRVLRTRAPTHMLVHFPCCAIWQFCARSTPKKKQLHRRFARVWSRCCLHFHSPPRVLRSKMLSFSHSISLVGGNGGGWLCWQFYTHVFICYERECDATDAVHARASSDQHRRQRQHRVCCAPYISATHCFSLFRSVVRDLSFDAPLAQ